VLSGDFAEYSALIAVRSSPRAAVKRRDDDGSMIQRRVEHGWCGRMRCTAHRQQALKPRDSCLSAPDHAHDAASRQPPTTAAVSTLQTQCRRVGSSLTQVRQIPFPLLPSPFPSSFPFLSLHLLLRLPFSSSFPFPPSPFLPPSRRPYRAYSKRVFALIVHSELKSVHPGFPVAFIF